MKSNRCQNIAVLNNYGYYHMMILFYLFTAILVGVPPEQTDSLYSISGTVVDYENNPLIGATVMVVGTPLGAMTNADGNYIITDVPVDLHEFRSSRIGMSEHLFHVTPSPGDTVQADLTLFFDGSSFPSIDQKSNCDIYSDTVEIIINDWRKLDVNHSQIWSHNQPVPSWKLNDSTVVAVLPDGIQIFAISVFPAPAILADVPEQGSTISVACDLSSERGREYTASGFNLRRV